MMLYSIKPVLGLIALLEVAAASKAGRRHHMDFHEKRDVVYVTQEVLEVVGYVSTVWVDPPTSTESPVEATIQTPIETPTIVETPSPVEETLAVVKSEAPIETPSPEPQPSPSPSPSPEPEVVVPSPSPQPEVAIPSPSPQPIQESSSSSSSGTGSKTGKATFYAAGMGSCGIESTDSEMIAALSKVTMSKTAGANPNNNPMCHKQIHVKSAKNPTGIKISIVDTCPGCSGEWDLDLSPAAFDLLGNQDDGVIDISWDFL